LESINGALAILAETAPAPIADPHEQKCAALEGLNDCLEVIQEDVGSIPPSQEHLPYLKQVIELCEAVKRDCHAIYVESLTELGRILNAQEQGKK
jgi:hypothetical protein